MQITGIVLSGQNKILLKMEKNGFFALPSMSNGLLDFLKNNYEKDITAKKAKPFVVDLTDYLPSLKKRYILISSNIPDLYSEVIVYKDFKWFDLDQAVRIINDKKFLSENLDLIRFLNGDFKFLTFDYMSLFGFEKLISGGDYLKSFVIKDLNLIPKLFIEKRFKELLLAMARRRLLLKHLKEIRTYDPELLKIYARRYRKASKKDFGSHFGIVQEINIAAVLIRKGIVFAKETKNTSDPDFWIEADDIPIECTSVQKSAEKKEDQDLEKKIIDKIREKNKQAEKGGFNNKRAMLAIDITNEEFHQVLNSQADWNPRKVIARVIEETSFGSIHLFTYILDNQRQRFGDHFIRIDSKNIDKKLVKFLEKVFPREDSQFLVEDGIVSFMP